MTRRKRMLELLEEEIREHLERETQDNIDRGMSPRMPVTRLCANSVMSGGSKSRHTMLDRYLARTVLQDIRFGVRRWAAALVSRSRPSWPLLLVLASMLVSSRWSTAWRFDCFLFRAPRRC